MRQGHILMVISLAIIFSLLQCLDKIQISRAQEADCGNGLTQRLHVGDAGWINLDPPLVPVKVRETPGGTQISAIEPGKFFRVINGPECTTNGLSWWKIAINNKDNMVETGWIAEGDAEGYFVEPYDLEGVWKGHNRAKRRVMMRDMVA